MNQLEQAAFEAAVEFQDAYHILQDQCWMTEDTVKRPGRAINSPTHVTNCLYYFRKAKTVLNKFPHPEFRKKLAELYLEFEAVRERAEEIIAREYGEDRRRRPDPGESEYLQAMIDAKPEFESARQEAELMLKE